MSYSAELSSCFTPFKSMVSPIPLPENFTFPFYYDPHELSVIAAQELQDRLSTENFDHNFGLEGNPEGQIIGKMFGVLVVKNKYGELGYLSAFSGKLGNSNDHKGFVPPVFDMLQDGSFFLEGIKQVNAFTEEINSKKNSPEYLRILNKAKQAKIDSEKEIEILREQMRELKKLRKVTRASLDPGMNMTERAIIENDLIRESLTKKYELKTLQAAWKERLEHIQDELNAEEAYIKDLKAQRKKLSNSLQQQIFDSYNFLNAEGKDKSLNDIFVGFGIPEPPSGAGECAAPKLLQYAYLNALTPICMAEFWWGASPKSEVRKHKQFYPSCRGKCEPILGHMLKGLNVDENPIIKMPEVILPLDIVYEDDSLVIINKPHEFLSVPGKSALPSAYDLVHERYPDATGSLIVHRLDMATSGILLFAKTNEANKYVQSQFIEKTVSKRYVAVLDGIIEDDEGVIDLPLRLDLDDRPRQLVCHEYGKRAVTKWKVIDRLHGKTRVHFFPITGRTHQLRVHAAHKDGLNAPIIGDTFYGTKEDRLHLHAEELTFKHPETREEITIVVPAPF